MAALLSLLSLASAAVAGPMMSSLEPSPLCGRGACTYDQLSCHNTTAVADTCCFESPGGLLMGVQLWDVNPATGPADGWTVHGLWPDNCDGTWGQFCDPSRELTNVTSVLIQHNRTDLLDFMQKWWKDQNGNDDSFWQHEWNKHGTCMSTFRPSCLDPGSSNGTDATLYFNTAVNLFKTRDTYKILAAAGVLPSATQSYTYDQLTAAVKSQIGFIPAFDCNNNTIFEISYYYNARGSLVDPQWVPIDAFTGGSCPKTGPLWYLPKGSTGPVTTATGSTAVSTSTGTITSSAPATTTTSTPCSTGLPTKVQLHLALADGSSPGCMLSKGTWAATGPSITCAGYTLIPDTSKIGSFTLKTSKGLCGVVDSLLVCDGSATTAALFQSVQTNGGHILGYQGATGFSSATLATGMTQVNVNVGDAGNNKFTLSVIPM